MNPEMVLLAHTGINPETLRRLIGERGAGGAVRSLRSGESATEHAREALAADPADLIAGLEAAGVALVLEADPSYPVWLRDLPDHPLWLFVKGGIPAQPGVAVVGSRRVTRYGADTARVIARRVSEAGWPVVSGLAAGVDASAHEGALDGGTPTFAVLGSGIDVWYPRRNRGLGERILAAGGGVLSESPPSTPPEPWRFPLRNRIISGLSGVTIVCEAAQRSGALITARLAIDHGRFVMAVPGDLTRKTSHGTNLLIRDGAYPLTSLEDIVSEVELILGPAPHEVNTAALPASGLLRHIGEIPVTVDDLAVRSAMTIPALLAELGDLESRGCVVVSQTGVRLA